MPKGCDPADPGAPTAFYSAGYNEAIRQRLGAPSATAPYIEAADLDALYAQV